MQYLIDEIENLNMSDQQRLAFDCGFGSLSLADTIELMGVTEMEFGTTYKPFYIHGLTFARNVKMLPKPWKIGGLNVQSN